MSYRIPEELARKEGKSYFPYERFELVERLGQCNLPPQREFQLHVASEAAGHDGDEPSLTVEDLDVAGHMARQLLRNYAVLD